MQHKCLMLSKTRTSEVKNDLESAIKSTLKLHRQLEMPITPKTLFFPVSFVLPNRRVCGGESSNWAQEGGNSQAHQK